MTQYKFNVNGQSVVGNLTWNAIGTLASLGVTDPFYSGGNQSCTYSHDDLTRIATANCGSVFSQTFSYDAFCNLSKSGTISFQPTYSTSTNQITQIGSTTPTYDANGSITADGTHTYTWDAAGRPVTIDGVSLTYDALGRMVEQNRSGTYTEIVYGPHGGKLALMSGQTLQKAFVPLAGGAVAVYTSSGLAYYRHSDWLGSSRFASTPTRTMYSDDAYTPFGEPYAQSGTAALSFTGMNQDTVSGLCDFPAREYATQGRWPSPDPSGLASVVLTDPQTLNEYAYVRNTPLEFFDPTGLLAVPSYLGGGGSCVYLNDAGTGLDDSAAPIDYNSNSTECGDHGGSWFDSTVDPSWVYPDPNSNWVFAKDTSGNVLDECHGDSDSCSAEAASAFFGTTTRVVVTAGDDSSPSALAAMAAIHDALEALPDVCSVGLTIRGGAGRVSLGADLNSDNGLQFATRSSLPPVGPVTVGASATGRNLPSSVNVRIPGTSFSVGAGTRNFKTLSSVNVGMRFGKFFNAQAYANINQTYHCH
jgi:RHS repeat-associated protein